MLRSLILYSLMLMACAESGKEPLGSSALTGVTLNTGPMAGYGATDGGVVLTAGSCGRIDSASPTTYPDGGPCDDSPVFESARWQDHPGKYVVSCDSKPAGERGCKGIPSDIWGRCNLRRCESTEVYPEGCTLYMPTENRWYPGAPQACTCLELSGSSDPTPRWTCGL